MIAFDPNAPSVRYFNIWRMFVGSIHLFPLDKDLARQACIAQALYEMETALEIVRQTKENQNGPSA